MTNIQTEINEAVAVAKAVRQTALTNAKIALEEQFNDNYKALFDKKLKEEAGVQTTDGTGRLNADIDDTIKESDIDALIKELESDIEGGGAAAPAPTGSADGAEAPETGTDGAGAPPVAAATATPAPEGVTAPEGTPVVQAPVIVVAPEAAGAPEGEMGGSPEGELPPSGAPKGAGTEDEINLDELLESLKKEIEEDETKEKLDEDTTLKSSGIGGKTGGSDNKKPASAASSSSKIESGGLKDNGVPQSKVEAKDATTAKRPNEGKNATSTNLSTPKQGGSAGPALKAARPNAKGDFENTAKLSEEIAAKDKVIKEQSAAINYLKNELNEINLLNTKLLYTNKLLKEFNVTNEQKVKIVEMFDLSHTIREVKMNYNTASEFLNFGGKGSASKKSNISQARVQSITEGIDKNVNGGGKPTKEIISEQAFDKARFQQLAGINANKK